MKMAFIIFTLTLSATSAFAAKVLGEGQISMLKLTGKVAHCEENESSAMSQRTKINSALIDAVEAFGAESAKKITIDGLTMNEKRYCFIINYRE